MGVSIADDVSKVKKYIDLLGSDFEWVEYERYKHMGAVITDAILQSGINYESVVVPRIKNLIGHLKGRYTTSEFLDLITESDPKMLLRWKGDTKINRIHRLTQFFVDQGIETLDDLSVWLNKDSNVKKLKSLNGIGNKTANYIKNLAGIPAVAVDIRLNNFLKQAGVTSSANQYSQKVIEQVAEQLGIRYDVLDHSIWNHMASRANDNSFKMTGCVSG